jgi:methylenetetrahydrofolate reductase (NADPH)
MQLVRDIYAGRRADGRPVISFEFFPPKTAEGDRNLLEKTIPALLQTQPDYCSVTYGAGGSTRDKTLRIVESIQGQHGLTAVAHLTCVSATKEQIGEFQVTPGGFEFSSQLVRFIREQGDFCIGVAGFPEGHIACKEGKYVDWTHLKEKVDAGADFVLTQLFFENADFHHFREHVTGKLGVKVPIVPGVVSILSGTQIKRFTAMCGASIPPALAARLDELGNDDKAVAEFGIEYATRQCEDLLRAGVPGIHFYTLNRAQATVRILKNLGLAR